MIKKSVGIALLLAMDFPVARALAAEVITEKAFEPIGDAACHRALEVLGSCERAICCLAQFGTMNRQNLLLKDYAQRHSLLVDAAEIERYAVSHGYGDARSAAR